MPLAHKPRIGNGNTMNAVTIRPKKQPSASLVNINGSPLLWLVNRNTSLTGTTKSDQAHLALPEAVVSNHKVGLPTQGRVARTFPDKDAPVTYLLAASGPVEQPGVEITPLGLNGKKGSLTALTCWHEKPTDGHYAPQVGQTIRERQGVGTMAAGSIPKTPTGRHLVV